MRALYKLKIKETMTKIKICGITRVEDALLAVESGADAIGLVFVERSTRCVKPAQAKKIMAALPPFVTVVGVFVDASPEFVSEVCQAVPLNLLQFHGSETPEQCDAYGLPYIRAIRMSDEVDAAAIMADYPNARGFLFDSYRADIAGGTGETFDWARFPKAADKPLILAGGLTLENAAEAVTQVRPYAVDVSGGVERIKGIKCPEKLKAFCEAVRCA